MTGRGTRGRLRELPLPPLLPLSPPRLGRGADELSKPGPLRPASGAGSVQQAARLSLPHRTPWAAHKPPESTS